MQSQAVTSTPIGNLSSAKEQITVSHFQQRQTLHFLGASNRMFEDIAKQKEPDLNSNDIDAAVLIIAGTAKSMGVEVDL